MSEEGKMKRSYLFASLVLLASCSAAAVYYQPIASTTYPPTATVDVYTTEKPKVEFEEIGIIVLTTEGSEKVMIKKAVSKAKEVGADGIILIGKETDSDSWRVDRSYQIPGAQSSMKFVAIKYRTKG